MSERMKCWKLETEDGDRDIVVMRTLMPMLISNRIMFTCTYHEFPEDGSAISIQSSNSNDYYYEKYKDQLGKDEVASHVISMTKMIPFADNSGVEMHQVICVNPNGMIPDFVLKKVAKA